jgi:large subunit ribosomal protein L25
MEQLNLKASNREVSGKGVKLLRRQGITPLHLFGHGVESLALQAETATVEKSLSQAGETRLIYLTVDKERKARPVLVREIQRDPLSRRLIHVDFYQVKMDEKVEVEVPIILVGKAPALDVKGNVIQQELESLTVEAFPDKIPTHISVDVSSLAEAGHLIRVSDIKVESGIDISTHADRVIVTVVAHAEEKVEEKAPVKEVVVTPEAEAAKEPKEES